MPTQLRGAGGGGGPAGRRGEERLIRQQETGKLLRKLQEVRGRGGAKRGKGSCLGGWKMREGAGLAVRGQGRKLPEARAEGVRFRAIGVRV